MKEREASDHDGEGTIIDLIPPIWSLPITGGGTAGSSYLWWKIPNTDLWSRLSILGDRIVLWVLAATLLLFYIAYGRKHQRFTLTNIRWLAVVVGYGLDFVLTLIVTSAYPDPFSPQHYFMSSLCTVIGSAVAVLIAKHQPFKHGILVVIADLTLLVAFSFFVPIDFGLKEIMRIIVALISAGFGASLAVVMIRLRHLYLYKG